MSLQAQRRMASGKAPSSTITPVPGCRTHHRLGHGITRTGTGTTAPAVPLIVYGRVLRLVPTPAADAYNDTVTMTVTTKWSRCGARFAAADYGHAACWPQADSITDPRR